MSTNIIQINNVSKLYRLGEVGTGTLSHDLNRLWAKLLGKEDPYMKVGSLNDRAVKSDSPYSWALKDISVTINQGDIIGVIGKNGAGKSTLLKILSRVTTPTKGSIRMKGRLASLLEVGTGFHPELTGRENIYLNGSLLGMTKKEINGKFDEIVEFSGCAKYIDTPTKRYSSGMTVRLAFAVAAFLEPEILVVDEVLAVGDAEFQKKAIGKMKDVCGNSDRTVLFVSHNMNAIQSLCTRGIVLEKGNLIFDGTVDESLSLYQEAYVKTQSEQRLQKNGYELNFKIKDEEDKEVIELESGKKSTFTIQITGSSLDIKPVLLFWISGPYGEKLFQVSSRLSEVTINPFRNALKVDITVDSINLMPGQYYFNLELRQPKGDKLVTWEAFQAVSVNFGNSNSSLSLPKNAGIVFSKSKWIIQAD